MFKILFMEKNSGLTEQIKYSYFRKYLFKILFDGYYLVFILSIGLCLNSCLK